jgi:hypothetical protein
VQLLKPTETVCSDIAMNKHSIFTADIACELITQKIKQYQLDYDIQETPTSLVIVIRKRFIEDKKKDEKDNLKMLDYDKDVTRHNSSIPAKPCEICSIRNSHKKEMAKLQQELSNQHKENSNIQNDIKRCQIEVIKMLKEEVSILKIEYREILHELHYIRQQLVTITRSKQTQNRTVQTSPFLDLERIKREILFGRATTQFQRFDN